MASFDSISNYLLLCFAGLLFCCSQPYEEQTRRFEAYLQEEYGEQIKDEVHYYILVPSVSCKGCRRNVYNINREARKMNDVSLIYSARALQRDFMEDEIQPESNMHVDSLDRISRLNFGVSNTMVLVTEKGKIQDIIEIKAKTNVPDLLQKFEAENTLHVGS